MATSWIVVLSRQLGPRHFELLCAHPHMVLTPDTVVEDERLLSGRAGKFLADCRAVMRDGVEHLEAIQVRPLGRNQVDIERLGEVRERFIAAGIGDPTGDPREHWDALVGARALERMSTWDPQKHLVEKFLAAQTIFPSTWWHDDPEPGIEEMVELVGTLKLPGELPTEALLAEANCDLDETPDETGARDRLCAKLVEAANRMLAASSDPRRFGRALDPVYGDGDPVWVLLAPEVYARLLREKLLTDWPGRSAAR
jgi:hypothetical protein